MSTIQTQASLTHLESGFSLGSAVQNNAQESAFTSGVISVDTAGEGLPWGDVKNAKHVLIKFLTGDPLLVGFDQVEYPLRLMAPGEIMLLRLNTELHSFQTTIIQTVDDIDGSLAGDYFDMADVDGPIRAWMKAPATAARASIIYGVPNPITSATGTITWGTPGPTNGDQVVINDMTFTKVDSAPASNQFDTILDLTTKAGNVTNVDASESGGVITLTATAGAFGNDFPLYMNVSAGSMTVSGFGTFAGGAEADTVSVNATIFTKVTASPTGNQFDNIDTLTALIEAMPGLSASDDGSVISILANPGAFGNDYALNLGNNTGTMDVNDFTGGHDESLPPPNPELKREIPIPYLIDDDAEEVALAIDAAFSADPKFSGATTVGNVVTIVDAATESRETTVDGVPGTGFNFSNGVVMTPFSPQVYFKSMGNTDIAIAIAPV